MRACIQRVSSASVTIDGRVAGAIDCGLLVLLGIAAGDTAADGEWLAQKIAQLRIFAGDAAGPEPGRAGPMNRSVQDLGGGILVISQFTLIASTRKGTRPSFNDAAKPGLAQSLYETFLAQIESALGRPVARGVFGALMQVALVNDGPVTIILDSRVRE